MEGSQPVLSLPSEVLFNCNSGGFRSAFRNAIIGGVFLAIMELIMVVQQQLQKRQQLAEEKRIVDEQIKEIEKMYGIKISKSH